MDPSEMLTNSVFGNLMVEVAESIAYDLNNEFVVLVRNEGIIPNFESRAIIEVAGTIGKMVQRAILMVTSILIIRD